MKRLALILICGLASACGDETDPPPVVGDECTGLSTCGAGPQNHVTVQFCENCFARPDTHVCEAGVCRQVDGSGSLRIGFQVPRGAEAGRSFAQVTLNPVRADGTAVTCASAMADTDFRDNPTYNAGNSNVQAFRPGPNADPSLSYFAFITADVGANRIALIRVLDQEQGKGNIIAEGCVDGLEIVSGQTTDVAVPITLR